MARTTVNDLKARRLDRMSAAERAELDATYAATKLALEVGEQVRDARDAAGLTQRELASRMGTSQAAIARLEAGGVGATLTTLQKVATALNLEVAVRNLSRSLRQLVVSRSV
jgi:ribosome-binding protein aMBF1 (putative translation factor)